MAKGTSKTGDAGAGKRVAKGAAGRELPVIAVAVSRYNARVTNALLEGAVRAYVERGGDATRVHVFDAPGSYELPALSLAAAETHRYGGVVALGCLVRGETRHDRYIAEAVSQGLVNVTIATGVPVAFGVLTVDRASQARDRAGGKKGNKGADAMHAVLDTIAAMERIMLGEAMNGSVIFRALPDKTGDAKAAKSASKPKKAGKKDDKVKAPESSGGGEGVTVKKGGR